MKTFISRVLLTILLVCFSLQVRSVADEIVISGNEHAVSVGDFDLSPCNTGSAQGALSVLCEGSNGEVTAGDLWKFFSHQGIDSVENLTICMDWAPSQGVSDNIGLASLELKIEDPNQSGNLITNASLGGDSLVVPGFEVSSFKPEAKLGVDLGYDFMKRFGPDSTEKIQLVGKPAFSVGDLAQAGTAGPLFSFEGSGAKPGRIPNLLGLVSFVAFWLVAFKFLAMMTNPVDVGGSPTANPGDIA